MFEKKRGTRFLASVMALVMLLSLAPVGALAAENKDQQENPAVTLPANGDDQKPVVTDEENTANTNEEPTPPPRNEGIATLPANNNNTPVALPETPVIVKPAEGLIDEAFGVNHDTSNSNDIAEHKGGNKGDREPVTTDSTTKYVIRFYVSNTGTKDYYGESNKYGIAGQPNSTIDGAEGGDTVTIMVSPDYAILTQCNDVAKGISTEEFKAVEVTGDTDVRAWLIKYAEKKVPDELTDRNNVNAIVNFVNTQYNNSGKNLPTLNANDFNGFRFVDAHYVNSGECSIHVHVQLIKENQYIVQYNPNGGSGAMVDENLYFPGDQATVKANEFTRTGYTFDGWNTQADGTGDDYSSGDSITIAGEEVTLYAQWTANTHKVTYTDGANGTVFSNVEKTGTYGEDIPKYNNENTDPTREGYKFKGWTSSVSGITPASVMPDQDVTFTATWNINSYSVTYQYEGNYPENAPALDSLNNNVPVPYGQTVTVDITVPAATVSGYTFSGWKIGTEDAGTQFSMPANNVVLKGSWTANGDTKYNVEYYQENLNGEYTKVETVPGTGTTGTSVTAEIKTYTGFTYNESVSTTSGKVEADGSLVLKLYYTRNTYTVTYMLDGVLYQEPVDYKFGASVTIKDDPQNLNDGLKFAGWKIGKDKATNFTMPAKDVTITGQTGKPWTTVEMPYVVEHYKWNGTNYKLADSDHFSALEGTKVTAIAKSYENEGYMLNPQVPDTIKEGTVVKPTLENDQVKMLTLKLYYDIDKIGDGENKDQPDGTPDRYQVTINYVSSNTNWGSVNRSKEVITLINEESSKWAETGTVTAPSCTATSAGGRCYFVNWTKKQEGSTASSTVISSANLTGQTIENAKGGDVYTFTANFDRSSGGSGGSSRPSTPTVTIPDNVPTGLNGKDHYAYIIGYGNNDVRPQNNITRAEVATIFFRLLTDETRTANMTKSNSYNDVKDGDWFCCAVSTLSKMGIIKGYEDGSFKPNDPISRAEFAAIAARFDPDGDKTPATFADVTSHWAKDEISIAANHGWIKGYEDGSFKPDQKITRAETMTLVNRVLNRLPETKDDLHKDMKTWVDNMDETAWYYLAVQEATNSHYFKNKTSTKFEQWTDLRDTRDWSELEK